MFALQCSNFGCMFFTYIMTGLKTGFNASFGDLKNDILKLKVEFKKEIKG